MLSTHIMHTALCDTIKHNNASYQISCDIESVCYLHTALCSRKNCNNAFHHAECYNRADLKTHNTFYITLYLPTLCVFVYMAS